jgi:hypothetical protein
MWARGANGLPIPRGLSRAVERGRTRGLREEGGTAHTFPRRTGHAIAAVPAQFRADQTHSPMPSQQTPALRITPLVRGDFQPAQPKSPLARRVAAGRVVSGSMLRASFRVKRGSNKSMAADSVDGERCSVSAALAQRRRRSAALPIWSGYSLFWKAQFPAACCGNGGRPLTSGRSPFPRYPGEGAF